LRALPGALVAVLGLAALPAVAHAERAFTPRFQANDTGSIVGVGNTLMTCKTSADDCSDSREHGPTTSSNSKLNNDNWDMTYVDVDSDDATFNSSRATLNLPSGAQVLFAGLYWGGDSSGRGDDAPPDDDALDKVKLKVPGASAYTNITGTVLDTASASPTEYFQAFKDVTAQVQAAGAGQYTVANVQSGTGQKHFAGWSLIVAYRDTSEPARNLTVFDGLKLIRSNAAPTTIDVTGFQTPPSGEVKTQLGLVTYEGDLGIVGDTASLNGHQLSDAQHPASNYFDSALSIDGAEMPGRSPSYRNQFGYDVTFQNADGLLANNATSAEIRVTTSGDQYVPGVITFATELYAPRIAQTKTVVDVNGGDVNPGDVLEYTIAGSNTGQDGAVDFTIDDPIPAHTTIVPGSLSVVDGAGSAAGPQTDAAGDDLAEVDGSTVRFRVGQGATAATGGKVAIGGTYAVRFSVVVGAGVSDGTKVTNVATASLRSESLGTPLTAKSTAAVIVKAPATPPQADVSIEKSASDLTPTGGQEVTYTLKATNHGPDKATGVKVADVLPPGVTFASASASCDRSGAVVTCNLGDLAKGASKTVTIKVTADVLPGGSGGSFAKDPHLIPVEKVEQQVDLEPGETKTVDLSCPSGQILTDGSVRTDAVDQGTGSPASVYVASAHGTSPNGWQAVVRNDASGRAQAKAFAVCIAGRTTPAAGHAHDLVVSNPVTAARALAAGEQQVTVDCPAATSPIVPGWAFDGGQARVRGSEPTATGWRFDVTVDAPTTATMSVRCLDDQVAAAAGHTHDLGLQHVAKDVTVPAGQIVQVDVICADDAKGIVGTWDLAGGVISLGNDPRPKTRSYRLYNPTGADAQATVDLECLKDRTGKGHAVGATPKDVVNTAKVTSTTTDPVAANDTDSVTITVQPGKAKKGKH
jgi:uncharacterized repeat protein (TIGR01451 family)